jgi:hypothetical protein
MAPGVGRAAAIALVTCLLTGLAWLPPRASSERAAERERLASEGSERVRLRRGRAEVARNLATANETLRFLLRRDSLITLLPPPDSAPRIVAAADVPEEWRAWAAEQADRLPTSRAAPAAPVLTALFVDTLETAEAYWRTWWGVNSTAIAFDSAAAPFSCLAIHDLRSRVRSADHRTLRPPGRWRSVSAFGICRFFARYGEPGPGPRTWLRNGGWQFGMTEGMGQRGAFAPSSFYRRSAFRYLIEEQLYDLDGCVHGTIRGCRDWLLAPPQRYGFRLGDRSAFASGWWSEFSGWLSDLEQEMGPDRLSRFWTSSLPVDSAFASAFGIDLGRWTYDWLAARYGPLPREGPRAADYAITLLMAGLLVAFGVAKALGRSVR